MVLTDRSPPYSSPPRQKSESPTQSEQDDDYTQESHPITGHTQEDVSDRTQGSPFGTVDTQQDDESPLIVMESTQSVLNTAIIAEEQGRQVFASDLQYILTCIGYAVGIGNIWRFPALAYENGGGAFLIPYITCAIAFGLPMIFVELTVGQYTRQGPSLAFRNYVPILQGIGWAMGFVSFSTAVFYNVINGWTGLYMFQTLAGNMYKASTCGNAWNTDVCSTITDNGAFNGSANSTSPAEEFFNYQILRRSNGLDEWGSFNWPLSISLFVCWSVTCLGLTKGVRLLGILSLFTATTPYIILLILLIRGLTLDGAMEGVKYYLFEPDWSYVTKLETWRQALSQCCISLSVGVGGLLAMSSYNNRDHNMFRDAVIIVAADSIMTIFGGLAVFSTLGFLAKQQNKHVTQVVESNLAIAYVAYPEAINRMPISGLWAFLFFLMLFLLGISSMFGYLMGAVTCVCDQFDFARRHQTIVVLVLGLLGFVLEASMCMGSGVYWFSILNDYVGSLSIAVCVIFEVIIINFFYGPQHFFDDVEEMLGSASHFVWRIFGASGWMMKFLTAFTAPLFTVVVVVVNCYHAPLKMRQNAGEYVFPEWSGYFGWGIGLLPLVFIPVFVVLNTVSNRKEGQPFSNVFRIQKTHPAYNRIHGIPESYRLIRR